MAEQAPLHDIAHNVRSRTNNKVIYMRHALDFVWDARVVWFIFKLRLAYNIALK